MFQCRMRMQSNVVMYDDAVKCFNVVYGCSQM